MLKSLLAIPSSALESETEFFNYICPTSISLIGKIKSINYIIFYDVSAM